MELLLQPRYPHTQWCRHIMDPADPTALAHKLTGKEREIQATTYLAMLALDTPTIGKFTKRLEANPELLQPTGIEELPTRTTMDECLTHLSASTEVIRRHLQKYLQLDLEPNTSRTRAQVNQLRAVHTGILILASLKKHLQALAQRDSHIQEKLTRVATKAFQDQLKRHRTPATSMEIQDTEHAINLGTQVLLERKADLQQDRPSNPATPSKFQQVINTLFPPPEDGEGPSPHRQAPDSTGLAKSSLASTNGNHAGAPTSHQRKANLETTKGYRDMNQPFMDHNIYLHNEDCPDGHAVTRVIPHAVTSTTSWDTRNSHT